MTRKRPAPRKYKEPERIPPTHYAVLGVERNATLAEITAAWRQMAKEYHTDMNPKGRVVFEQAQKAWKVLSEDRAAYDRSLGIKPEAQAFGEAGFSRL